MFDWFRTIVTCLVLVFTLKYAVFWITGVYVGLINPFYLSITNVHYRGLRIGYIRYSLFQHMLLIEDVDVNDLGSFKRKTRSPSVKEPHSFKMKLKNSRAFCAFSRLLGTVTIKASNASVKELGLVLNSLTLTLAIQNPADEMVNMCNDTEKELKANIYVLGLKVNDVTVCKMGGIETRAIVHPQSGVIREAQVFFKVRNTTIPLSKIFSLVKKSPKTASGPDVQACQEDVTQMIKIIQKKMHYFYLFSKSVSTIDISLDNVLLGDIPLTNNKEFIGKGMTFDVSVSSLSVVLTKFRTGTPGFSLYFDKEDEPYKISFTVARLQGFMKFEEKKVQLLEFPSLSVYGDTNIFTKAAQVSDSDSLSLDSLFQLTGHLSSPTFDVDTEYWSVIRVFISNLKEFQKKSKNGSTVSFGQKVYNRQHISMFFKNILPTVACKITIEDPMLIIKNETDIIVNKLSIVSLQFDSQRYTLGKDEFYKVDNRLELLNFTSTFYDKAMSTQIEMVKLETFSAKWSTQWLPDLQIDIDVDFDNLFVDQSDLHNIVSMHDMLHLIQQQMKSVDNTYFNGIYQSALQEHKKPLDVALLFEKPPAFFNGLRIKATNVVGVFGARSVLMPKELFSHLDKVSADDLVGGELRKLLHSIDSISLQFLPNSGSGGVQPMSNNDSDSTLVSELVDDDRGLSEDMSIDNFDMGDEQWAVKLIFQKASWKVYSETKSSRDILTEKTFLKLPCIQLHAFPQVREDGTKCVRVQCNVERVDFLFTLIGAFVIISVLDTAKKLWTTTDKKKSPGKKETTNLAKYFNFSMSVGEFSMVMVLQKVLKTRLELINFNVSFDHGSELSVFGNYLRICVESPVDIDFWLRLLCIVDFKILVQLDKLKSDGISVELENETSHFSIPHKFVMYKVFDNVITTAKTMKALVNALNHGPPKLEGPTMPTLMKAPVLPGIKLRSKRFLFSVDDDPFEAEMNMIFQIGLEEQRIRQQKYQMFESQVIRDAEERERSKQRKPSAAPLQKRKDMNVKNVKFCRFANIFALSSLCKESPKDDTPDIISPEMSIMADCLDYDAAEKLDTLQKNIAKSWIERVNSFRLKESSYFKENFDFIWGTTDQDALPDDFNHRVMEFTPSPPLFTMIFSAIDIDLKPPSFGVEGIPQFINSIGKGVPLDLEYSIMIPMHIDARLGEIRAHLRDYPLPFIYMPGLTNDQDQNLVANKISGDIIFSEDMVQSIKELRHIYVPLVPSAREDVDDSYYSLIVTRTITALKLYSDLMIQLNSAENTHVTWCGSYQPAISQTMACLDNFSKPPLDPSEKSGFWDKIRYTFHSRIKFIWNNGGGLHVALKGANSPYMIGSHSAGYMIAFQDNVTLECNGSDDPMSFLAAHATKIMFVVPNFSTKPLLVWCKPSSEAIYPFAYPHASLQRRCSYYYLLDDPILLTEHQIDKMRKRYFEKVAIMLSGGVTFNLGLVFERNNGETRTFTSRPHYDVRLCHPDFVKDANYDAFRGFRSDYIHMSFYLKSKNEDAAYNVIQLSPGAFKVFFKWWSSFRSSNIVRRGVLFGDQNGSTAKFGNHLFSISYKADVEPIFISHMFKKFAPHENEMLSTNNVEFVGIKVKASKFLMDLHQRKEADDSFNQFSHMVEKVLSLNMHVGEVRLTDIDMRAVNAKFTKSDNPTCQEGEWIDIQEFDDVGFSAMDEMTSDITIMPLLHSRMFLYRKHARFGDDHQIDIKTGEKIVPFNPGCSHNCSLVDDIPSGNLLTDRLQELRGMLETRVDKNDVHRAIEFVEKVQGSIENGLDVLGISKHETFANKYVVYGMLLKWNEENRDVVFRYLHSFQMMRQMRSMLKSVHNEPESMTKESMKIPNLHTSSEGTPLEQFENDLRKLSSSLQHITHDKHFIQMIAPQIQLVTKDNLDSCMLVAAPSIKMKIVGYDSNTMGNEYEENEFLTRLSAVLLNANTYVFDKGLMPNPLFFHTHAYGGTGAWPPFLTIESTLDPSFLSEYALISGFSANLQFDQHTSGQLMCNLPKFKITCDSAQYSTLFSIVVNLLIYTEPLSQDLNKQIEKLALSYESSDIIRARITRLQSLFSGLRLVEQELSFRKYLLDDGEQSDLSLVRTNMKNVLYELYILNKVLTGASANSGTGEWEIKVGECVFEMLDESRRQFLEVSIFESFFKRVENEDGLNTNEIGITSVSVLNKNPSALFHHLLGPGSDDIMDLIDNTYMVYIKWDMAKPVGGIKIIKDVITHCAPIKLQIEDAIAHQIFKWVFPNAKALSKDDISIFSEGAEDISSTVSLYSDIELEEMVKRSNDFMTVESFHLDGFKLCISYKGTGKMRLVNVTNFDFDFPAVKFENKTMTMVDLTILIQKVLTRALIRHSGKFLGNKLTRHKLRDSL